jgi:hypothetical protein
MDLERKGQKFTIIRRDMVTWVFWTQTRKEKGGVAEEIRECRWEDD